MSEDLHVTFILLQKTEEFMQVLLVFRDFVEQLLLSYRHASFFWTGDICQASVSFPSLVKVWEQTSRPQHTVWMLLYTKCLLKCGMHILLETLKILFHTVLESWGCISEAICYSVAFAQPPQDYEGWISKLCLGSVYWIKLSTDTLKCVLNVWYRLYIGDFLFLFCY